MMPPNLVFVLFAALAAAGSYLIVAHQRGRLAGAGAALLTLVFFAAVFAGLMALMRGWGSP
jgi:hypothetical protein